MTSSAPEQNYPLVVVGKTTVAEGVVEIALESATGEALPSWAPGAHIDLHCDDGEAPLVRQYSLCGQTSDRKSYRVAVRREEHGRGGSRFVHDTLTMGTLVTVGGPRNLFPLREAPRYVFIAGGIGVTPMLPMIAAAQASGAEWRLAYGGRNRASMPFLDHLLSLGPDRVSVVPEDEEGLLDLDALFADLSSDTAVYCCGPEPLLQVVEKHAADWRGATLHIERFAPREVEAASNAPFEIEIASTGMVLDVPADRSALDVMLDAGIPVAYACAEGTCASCGTEVISGKIEHRDSLLTPEERNLDKIMYVCVSRGRCERIVLDL
ncbi:PDR/VanB family oxidoreductase [Rhodococcus koreensis]